MFCCIITKRKKKSGSKAEIEDSIFTWDDLEILACGRMGMSISYLYSLTPRQFDNIQQGWNANLEMSTKTSWEQTRKLFEVIIRPHLKDKNKTAFDLLPFPWDIKEKESEEKEQESFEEMADRWSEIDKVEREKITLGGF